MFYRNEQYMSIPHMAIFVYLTTQHYFLWLIKFFRLVSDPIGLYSHRHSKGRSFLDLELLLILCSRDILEMFKRKFSRLNLKKILFQI